MKIAYSNKIIVALAVVNAVIIGNLFYWLVFKDNAENEMNQRCNLKILKENLIDKPLIIKEFININEKDKQTDLTKGKVLLTVFLTNCQACLKEFEILEKHQSLNKSGFNVIAITSESREIVTNFVRERNLKFPIYLDPNGSLALTMKVTCTPTMFFLENGIVRGVKIGLTEDYQSLMEVFEK